MTNRNSCVRNNVLSTVYWDSLAFLDIIATILLMNRPKIGILLTFVIIAVDVIHNNVVLLVANQHMNEIGFKMWATKYWMLTGQLLFMIFVVATMKGNLSEINYKLTFKNNTNEKKSRD